MTDGGKGSARRPRKITEEQFMENWARIFSENPDNTGTSKNEYYDLLTTEDALLDSEYDKSTRNNAETQEILNKG